MRITYRQAATVAAVVLAACSGASVYAAPTFTWTVDCTRGQSIAQALERAPARKLMLIVRGYCNENVVIDRDDVTLQGDPAGGATVNGPSADTPTIDIAANRITIDGLTVTGGRSGINIYGASNIRIADSVVRNSGLDGISIAQSQAVSITNSKVQYAASIGIVANRGGLLIGNSEVSFNKAGGVHIASGSNLTANASSFSSNGAHGLGVFNASEAMVWDTRIIGNGTDPTAFFREGVYVAASHAEFRNSTIADNARFGMVVTGRAGVFNSGITGNGDSGIIVLVGSTLNVDGGTISGNKGNGIFLIANSTGQIASGAKIQNNTKHGIELYGGGKLWLISPITVGGNTWFGLYCNDAESSAYDTSWISFSPPNAYADMSCTGY
jgi:hypothetical protein